MNALLLSFQESSIREIFSTLIVICLFSTILFGQTEQGKIVNPSMTIVPNDADISDPVNIGLFNALPVGDINGDGVEDFVFNSWSADETTTDPEDLIVKSVITIDTSISSAIVLYGSEILGIGDFNGDSYDDVLSMKDHTIHFGYSSGISDDSLFINYPSTFDDVFFYGDLNKDGFSEFILGQRYEWGDSLVVFSGENTEPMYIITTSWTYSFGKEETMFYSYDYDHDGHDELCLTTDDYNQDRLIKWFFLDKENNQMINEETVSRDYIHEPTGSYPREFCDINGDNRIDIAHVYYEYDSLKKYHLEVYFGLGSYPYFDTAVEVELGNNTRMFYSCGDFNNDGADDWYSVINEDSVVLYYGGEDVATTGFQKQYYSTGNNQQYLLKGRYLGDFILVYPVEKYYYNADTIPDLYFNYWSYDENLRFDKTGTAVILGGENPDFENPIVFGKSGVQAFNDLEYGYSTKAIGDINQDGYDDWGVLARTGCYLDVFLGGQEIDSIPDIKYLLPRQGKAKSGDWTSGDLNGDGWIDIIISNGSPSKIRYTKGFITEVEDIYIFYGGPSLQNVYNYLDADVILNGMDSFYDFGKNLSVVGDYNADGFNDLVVGSGLCKIFKRRAFVYLGGEEIGPEPDLDILLPGQFYGSFANPITPCGDINADGFDDFTLGDGWYGAGQTLVYYGGPFADANSDLVIPNPVPSGVHFGMISSHSKGDFDGDGFNDLLQYSYFNKEIYVLKGGPQFDNIPDYTFYDPDFTPQFGTLEFIDRSFESGVSDILINYRFNDVYYTRLYQGGFIQSGNWISLTGCLGYSSFSVASGDFNNDGLSEIFTGFSNERNYGWPRGGVVKLYVPANYVISNIEQTNKSDSYLSIYPNPVNSVITVEFDVQKPGDVSILIVNMLGEIETKLKRQFTSAGKNNTEINPGALKNGVYILEVRQGTSISRKKFIFAK